MRNQWTGEQANFWIKEKNFGVAETRAGQIIDLGSKPKKIRDSG